MQVARKIIEGNSYARKGFYRASALMAEDFFSAGQAVFIDSLGLNIIRFVHSRKRFEACGSDCLLIKQMEEI